MRDRLIPIAQAAVGGIAAALITAVVYVIWRLFS